MRKACMEPISFRPDGTIAEVEMTTQGVGGPMSPLLRMEASRACLMSGNLWTTVRRPPHDTPVEYLTGIRNNDCAYWKYYDFNLADVNHFICKTWDKNTEARIEIRIDSPDGPLLGVCPVAATQGNLAYAIHETDIKPVRGKHALVLVFKGEEGKDLMNLEWFTFTRRKQ